jgi:S-adenosylmethionine hydrolase
LAVTMSDRPTITFLSDYGLADEFVGVVHGVIAQQCPEARVIDLTHGIPRHDVLAGALTLRNALPYMPAGVALAVVDPDVGARRRAVAIECADGRMLVGPDNGLLTLVPERFGGIVAAADISDSPLRLEPVAATFHGRDVFAPVAAHLAAGTPLGETGRPLDPELLAHISLPEPERDGNAVRLHVLIVDAFGNVSLNATHDDLVRAGLSFGDRLRVESDQGAITAVYGRTFADVAIGEPLVYEDAARMLAVAVNKGDAADRLGVMRGDEVRVRAA